MPRVTANDIAVQINSATSTPRRYYRAFAEYLADRGFAVLTYDYRGVGDSVTVPLRRDRARALDWGALDQVAATEFLRVHLPDRRLAVVGHSLGGQLLGLSPHAGEIEAALLVAAPHGYWRHWSGKRLWRNLFLWFFFIPVLTPLFGYFPGRWFGMTDLPAGFATQWAHWCRNPNYLSDERGQALRPYNHLIRSPMRQIRFGDDPIAPDAAVRALLEIYPNAERRYDRLEPDHFDLQEVGHFGFFRRTMPRTAWADAADWLAAHTRG